MSAYTDAVRLCYERQCGKTQDLIQHIGEDNFALFCATGMIKQGVESQDGNNVSTWAITNALNEEYNFYFEDLSKEEVAVIEQFEALFV